MYAESLAKSGKTQIVKAIKEDFHELNMGYKLRVETYKIRTSIIIDRST